MGIQTKRVDAKTTVLDASLIVIPNPATDHILVRYENDLHQEMKIIIMDIMGREVKNLVTNETEAIINLDRFANGTYQIMIIKNNQTIGVEKVVVNK